MVADRDSWAARCRSAEIFVDLRGMNQIIAVDPRRARRGSRLARVGGVGEKTNRVGFILGHDPWTLPVATVGGAISTNSVGYRAGRYGSMGQQVLGLEAVLADGEILRTRAVPKSSAGIDLNSLLIGGEGCFGIITEATVRISPAPQERVLSGLVRVLRSWVHRHPRDVSAAGGPGVLDFGDSDEKHQPGAILYLGFEGNREVVNAEGNAALDL